VVTTVMVLHPGQIVECTWTEAGYAGAPGAAGKVNVASVKVSEVGNPTNSATDHDDSIVTTVPPAAPITVSVVKTNDANGDGVFTDDETGTAGGSVTFRAVITNTSAVAVVIDSIIDEWPQAEAIAVCPSLVGITLPPGASMTCEFTVAGYAPSAAAGAKVDTVSVGAHAESNPANKATASDTSTVRGIQVLGETITRAPSLPRTGSGNDMALVSFGMTLIGIGLVLLLGSRWHGRVIAPSWPASTGALLYNLHPPVIDRRLERRLRMHGSPSPVRWRNQRR
jgi:hypothetical protein